MLWQKVRTAFFLLALPLLTTTSVHALTPIEVDWESSLRPLPATFYGMNHFKSVDAKKKKGEDAWRSGMDYMGIRALRLHNGGLLQAWYDDKSDDWRYEKIEAVLKSGDIDNPVQVISIPGWPASYSIAPEEKSARLAPAKVEKYIELCNRLVAYVQKVLPGKTLYIEIPNEKEKLYEDSGKSRDEYARTVGRIAAGIKAQNPGVKVGGPAFSSVSAEQDIVRFAALAGDRIDFLSLHYYATGTTLSNNWLVTRSFSAAADSIQKIATASNRKRKMPLEILLTEFNINYKWRDPDARMTGSESPVFDIYFLGKLAPVKQLTAAYAWNDMDGVYGKMNSAGELRPGAAAYHVLARKFTGLLHNTSYKASGLSVMAVTQEGSKRIAIANPGSWSQTVRISARKAAGQSTFEGIFLGTAAPGPAQPVEKSTLQYVEGNTLEIPAMSAVLLWEAPAGNAPSYPNDTTSP